MKRISLLLIAISLLYSCSKNSNSYPGTQAAAEDTLSTGWSFGTAPANAGIITDIKFTDPLHGYAVSATGIFKSANGGSSWSSFGTATNYFSMAAINSNACFVNGTNTILNTQDGVTLTPSAYTSAQGFLNCFFASPTACYAINSNAVWKSNTGGSFFNLLYSFPSSYTGKSVIMFTDELEGFAARGTDLYSTYDGGSSFNHVATATSVITSVLDQNGSTIYYATATGLYRSYNGGGTWSLVLQYPSSENADIQFINSTLLYLSAGTRIYKSSDAGNTWSKVVSLGAGKSILKVCFNDESHGWACGNFGILKFSN